MANFGAKALVMGAGAAIAVVGLKAWEGQYDDAQSIRGRSTDFNGQMVANYIGDIPNLLGQIIDPPNYEGTQEWEVPFNWATVYGAIALAGIGTAVVGYKKL